MISNVEIVKFGLMLNMVILVLVVLVLFMNVIFEYFEKNIINCFEVMFNE